MTIARLALMTATVLLCASASSALTVTRAGEPVAKIAIPLQPTATEQFAADELQSYLQQITGATVVIGPEQQIADGPRLLVGATQAGRELAPIEGDAVSYTHLRAHET